MAPILGIIPSRFGSTRFPAKALAEINGKSMVQRVYEQSKKSTLLTDVVVATDHLQIYEHVLSFGGKVVMTDEKHASGTDRCAEAFTKLNENFDFVINIQGDEPFIKPEQIDELASILVSNIELATLVLKINDNEAIQSANTVKVAINTKNEALYFSRNPIPFVRNFSKNEWGQHQTFLRHIGIYAYRADILMKVTNLSTSSLELAESLEQLRWLENGYKITVKETKYESFGIDTPEDLEKILAMGIK
ncbi:MAG: 3-deoxy-manno-octulosonate cytidylyltransferase [Cytophagales bacterium]